MKNLLALVGAAVIGFGVAGWYLGWYQIGVTKSNDGNLHVETNVNTRKVADDSGDALKRAGAFIGNRVDQAATDAKAGTPPTPPGTTPGPQDQKDQKDQKVSIFGFDLSPKK